MSQIERICTIIKKRLFNLFFVCYLTGCSVTYGRCNAHSLSLFSCALLQHDFKRQKKGHIPNVENRLLKRNCGGRCAMFTFQAILQCSLPHRLVFNCNFNWYTSGNAFSKHWNNIYFCCWWWCWCASLSKYQPQFHFVNGPFFFCVFAAFLCIFYSNLRFVNNTICAHGCTTAKITSSKDGRFCVTCCTGHIPLVIYFFPLSNDLT